MLTPAKRAAKIMPLLRKRYGSQTALRHRSHYELIVAVILSAQCTDVQVNKVTPALFKEYPTVQRLAKADISDVQQIIRSTGFYKSKAKAITTMAKQVVEYYNGKIPDSMEELTKLHGVARKTANVVLGAGFGKVEGIVVDTHVARISQRLGLTKNKNPVKIEKDLMQILPKKDWWDYSGTIIWHGRQTCVAKKPKCPECILRDNCPSAGKFIKEFYSGQGPCANLCLK